MYAMTYRGNRKFEMESVEPAAPGPGQVRIDVAYTGICGTDLHIYHGDMDARVAIPAVIGHEMSGVVDAIGDGVATCRVGDRVTVMPLDWCGNCPACRAGHWHICHRLNFLGIDSPGSLQNSWTIPERAVIVLPDQLDLQEAALIEPTAVACHDVARAELRPGEQVLVVGGGPIGLLIAQVATRLGGEVLLTELNPYRRSLAHSLGIAVHDPATQDIDAVLDRWTNGAGVAVAFEVSGAAGGVLTAVAALATRGRLVQVAIHPNPRPIDLHRFFWRELTLLGARLYDRSDFERAIGMMRDGHVNVRSLISTVFPLQNAQEALSALDGGAQVMKVLIDCRADTL